MDPMLNLLFEDHAIPLLRVPLEVMLVVVAVGDWRVDDVEDAIVF